MQPRLTCSKITLTMSHIAARQDKPVTPALTMPVIHSALSMSCRQAKLETLLQPHSAAAWQCFAHLQVVLH